MKFIRSSAVPKSYLICFLFSSYIMSYLRYDLVELISNITVIFNATATFIAALSLHFILFFIFKKTIPNLWSASLTLLSLSVYREYPFRNFFNTFLSNFKPPAVPEHIIFSDSLMTTAAILATLTVLISTSRNLNIYFRIITSTVMTAALAVTSILDAMFLSLFYVVYWPVQLKLKRDLLSSLLTVVFGATITIICIVNLQRAGCNPNCIDAPSWYYLGLYLLLPACLMGLVYAFYKVDPYEIFIRFRTLYVLLALELSLVLAVAADPFDKTMFVPEFVLGQTLLHMYYYVPIIYYITRKPDWLSNKGVRLLPNFIDNVVSSVVKRHSEILCCLILLIFLYNFQANIGYL